MSTEVSFDNRNLMLLGARLREARGKESARKVAARAGISAVYLRTLENVVNRKTGKPSTPSSETCERLSQALNIDPVELLSLSNRTPRINDASSIPDNFAQDVILRLRVIEQRKRDLAAELVRTGQVGENNTDALFHELAQADAYKKAIGRIDVVLQDLTRDLSTIDERFPQQSS